MDLVDFLRARLDEDEEIARGHEQWSASWHQDDCVNEIRDDENAGTVAHVFRLGDRTHIARHDPARVLAEVDAKRRILDLHELEYRERPERVLGEADDPFCAECCSEGFPCATLRLLALPYASHPDYRTDWRP